MGKVRKKLETIERRKSERTKNNENNKKKGRRNQAREFGTQRVDRRRQ